MPAWLALNVVAAICVAHAYVQAAAAPAPALYGHLALAAAILATATVLGGLLAGVTVLPGGTILALVAAPVAAAGLLAFLWVDRAAFATYRFHVGGLAWSALRMPGGLAELGVRPAAPGALLGATALLVVLDGLALRWLASRSARGRGPAGGWRWLVAAAAAAVLLERGAFLLAEQRGRRDVVRMAQVVPFYSVLMANDLRRIWPAPADAPPGQDGVGATAVPPVRFAPGAPRWNVLWIVLDSWRADAMTPELTPIVSALGRRSTVFRSHTSGGDATRYGLVSMLYGLPAATWSRLEMERRAPPLLATLRARGWRLGLFSSLDLPDVTSVMFADVPAASRLIAPPARLGAKDRATIAALERFLASPPPPPFFAFVHLLSTHWGYDPSCALPRDRRGGRARYERAVRCADRLVGRALRRVSLADTVVVVTADHGEAFGEDGVVGHAAGFTIPQLRVPLVLHVPGMPAAVVDYPTTHHDVAATLLAVLGAETPTLAGGIGRSLLGGAPASRIFACNMTECAIHDAAGSVVFGVGTRYPGQLDIRDPHGVRLPTDGDEGRRRLSQVLELLALQRDALP